VAGSAPNIGVLAKGSGLQVAGFAPKSEALAVFSAIQAGSILIDVPVVIVLPSARQAV
jgi:hypothetical protein